MSEFTKPELKAYEAAGILAAAAGLTMALIGRAYYDPDANGSEYIAALRNTGWIILGLAAAWTVLSSLHLRTTFFSLDHPTNANIVGLSLAIILAGVVLMYVLIIPQLPSTPPEKLPQEPGPREQIVKQEQGFKILVSSAIFLIGGAVAFFPLRKFLKR
jgi:magnesium-transporting ATPase (P-type)